MRQLVSAGLPVSDNTGLVFVGHSLGGLMIKAALEQASRSDDTKERRLVERCVGVAFIGTPHSGSGLAWLLANLDKLLGTVGTGARFATWISGAPLIGQAIAGAAGLGAWFAEPSNAVEWLKAAAADLRERAEEYRERQEVGGGVPAMYDTV